MKYDKSVYEKGISDMNNNFCKRTLTGILALGMVLSAASCSSSTNSNNNSKSGNKNAKQTESKVVNAYSAADLDTDFSFSYVDSIEKLGDTGKILISGYDNENSVICLTDSDFSAFEEIKVGDEGSKKENAQSSYLCGASSTGTIFVIENTTDYGDFKLPDWDDPNFDFEKFDYEAMEKAATYKSSVYTLDKDGKLISSNEITGIDKYSSDEFNATISQIIPVDDEKAIISVSGEENKYVILGSDGKLQNELDLGEDAWIGTSCMDKDGNLSFMSWEDGGTVIKSVDMKTLKMTDKNISLKGTDAGNSNGICCGNGDYDYFLAGQNGIYGVKSDGSSEEVVNWIDSDFNGNYVNTVYAADNGDFIIFNQDWNTGESGFYRLTQRDASELQNAQVITLGMLYMNPDISSKVTEFNKSHTDTRIKIVDYSKYDDYDAETGKMLSSSEDQLKLDIVSGNAPDMIFVYDPGLIKSVASKGVFADLYDLIGKNGTPGKDEFLPNVLKCCESDGKLVTITPSFSVSTMAAKTKLLNGKTTWTVKELIEAYKALPSGTKLFSEYNTRDSVMNALLSTASDLIDTEHGKCNYNTPEFIETLKFCKEFPEEEGFNWETASQSDVQNYFNESSIAYRKDKAFVFEADLSDPSTYGEMKQGRFGDDITLIGYPTNEGNGGIIRCYTCLSIMNSAADKEACWNFISQFFTDEYQNSDHIMGMLPSTKKAFEAAMQKATQKPYYTDSDGKKVEYDQTYSAGSEEIKINPLTEDELAIVKDYILNTTYTGKSYVSEEVSNIINEETAAFFKGERTAEETAELLQNRISIIVSEQS